MTHRPVAMTRLLALALCTATVASLPARAQAPAASPPPHVVIIDADPGIDDAIAILFALGSPALDVIGITTGFGNADIAQTTRNALRLTELAGRAIPVARGASEPWAIPLQPPPDFVHGADGLGNIQTTPLQTQPIDTSAAEFIVATLRDRPGEVTLLALGRLTNLAMALAIEPELPRLAKQVVIMGGAAHVPGNVSPVAEANVSGDPHAADAVFTAPWKVTMVGLDVTTQVRLGDDVLSRIADRNPLVGGFVYRITRYYRSFYESIGLTGGFYVHDPSAVAYVIDPTLFTTEKAVVRVATEGLAAGQTITAPPDPPAAWRPWHALPAVEVSVGVDSERLLELLESTLSQFEPARH